MTKPKKHPNTSGGAIRDRLDRIEPRLLSIEDAARALSIGRALTYRLLADGDLRAVKIGGRRMIPVIEVDRYVKALIKRTAAEDAADGV